MGGFGLALAESGAANQNRSGNKRANSLIHLYSISFVNEHDRRRSN
jgi:hypothetical protein